MEPLEETRGAYIFVTERVVCHLGHYINSFVDLPNAAAVREQVAPSDLEVKHGLIQASVGLGLPYLL